MQFWTFVVSCIAIPASSTVYAHGGGLNGQGCHNNRKTGDYHCHGGGDGPSRPRLVSRRPDPVPGNTLTPSGGSGPGRAFANCTEARAHGAAPVHRGDPGYGSHLDRDNDGVGCES
jgi:hypothetical protein